MCHRPQRYAGWSAGNADSAGGSAGQSRRQRNHLVLARLPKPGTSTTHTQLYRSFLISPQSHALPDSRLFSNWTFLNKKKHHFNFVYYSSGYCLLRRNFLARTSSKAQRAWFAHISLALMSCCSRRREYWRNGRVTLRRRSGSETSSQRSGTSNYLLWVNTLRFFNSSRRIIITKNFTCWSFIVWAASLSSIPYKNYVLNHSKSILPDVKRFIAASKRQYMSKFTNINVHLQNNTLLVKFLQNLVSSLSSSSPAFLQWTKSRNADWH